MKKTHLLLFILILFLSNCKTTDNNENNTNIFESHVDFNFLGLNLEVNPNDSTLNNDEIYKVKYNINFLFENQNNNILCSYKIFDNENNNLLSKEKIKVENRENEKNIYIIQDYFTDQFVYKKLKYELTVKVGDKEENFKGNFEIENMPVIENLEIGPIIKKYENNKINIALSINFDIYDCEYIKWIRLIPPSQDSFWSLPWENTDNKSYKSSALIYNKKNNYIDNGKYYLQINFKEYGIIQKEIDIIDFFQNKKGPNYGLPIAGILENDKDYIKLDIDLIGKIDYIEFYIYQTINGTDQKIGTATLSTPSIIISKKALRNLFKDDQGLPLKLKNNKDYNCIIYLYSNKYNGIQYISISDPFIIKFQSFINFSF